MSTTFAAHDFKDSVKSKRAYSLGYTAYPYAYDHDIIDHAPTVIHHDPAVTTLHHAPITAVHHAVPAIHAPYIAPTISKTSVLTTNVHAPLVAAHPSPYLSSAYVASHPVIAASPLFTEFHHRR